MIKIGCLGKPCGDHDQGAHEFRSDCVVVQPGTDIIITPPNPWGLWSRCPRLLLRRDAAPRPATVLLPANARSVPPIVRSSARQFADPAQRAQPDTSSFTRAQELLRADIADVCAAARLCKITMMPTEEVFSDPIPARRERSAETIIVRKLDAHPPGPSRRPMSRGDEQERPRPAALHRLRDLARASEHAPRRCAGREAVRAWWDPRLRPDLPPVS